MAADSYTTLERIHQAAQAEFLEKGFQRASLRSIVKSVGMTTALSMAIIRARRRFLRLW